MILGTQQISSLSSATGLTIPANGNGQKATWALIQTETAPVRFDFEVTPTASLGLRLQTGQTLRLNQNLEQFKAILESGSPKLNVIYGIGIMPDIM